MKLEQLQIKRNYNHLMLPLTITLSLIVIRVIELILLVLQLRPIKITIYIRGSVTDAVEKSTKSSITLLSNFS